ncbi:IclR family transcriptional regulator [Aeromicrobium sp.]|uniref:IclR family transcriptional regulator n=1 Tax=Aeromicrobium sp. TaxID=1871063 RepID=UPI003C3ADA40
MSGNATAPGASVSSRLLAVLGAFDEGARQLSLTELSRRSGLPLSTTHRLLGELVEWGALRRADDGRYVLGRRMWEIGLLAPIQVEVREIASPFLSDVFAATQATVHLAVREGTKALYVERLSGHRSVPVVSSVGSRLPLHATGVGKVLLAHAPERVQLEALADLTRETPYTIVAPGTLRQQLVQVRERGYARTDEEMSLGACSVAVPVLDDSGSVAAAVGIVVPSLRRDAPRLVAALTTASAGITRQWRALVR